MPFPISSWVVACLWACDSIRKLADTNRAETLGILSLLVLFFGLICDDLGSRLESSWLDGRVTDGIPAAKHEENWYRYLRQAFTVEPVGHRYLRMLVLHLKFELGTGVAFILALPGIWWLPVAFEWRFLLTTTVAVIPESGVKTDSRCEFHADLARFPLHIFVVTLTSLLVRLRSACVDRLEMSKSPLATGP